MPNRQAVILHRHILFRDLIELELRDLGPMEIAYATSDRDAALGLLLEHGINALIVESTEGFIGRRDMLLLFCEAAEQIPEFMLVSANLATSEVEVLQDTIAQHPHLASLKPLLQGVAS